MSVYAVNAKEPIATWIPSLDTVGNGTTTLTDLVGTNNGTLTNFALTGSTSNWVSDTDAGGVRAIAFDGVDDVIIVPASTVFNLGSSFTISLWLKSSSTTQMNKYLISRTRTSSDGDNAWSLIYEYTNDIVEFYSGDFTGTAPRTGSGITVADTAWNHLLYSYDGATWKGYKNGTSVFSVSRTFALNTSTKDVFIGNIRGPAAANVAARFDDIRIFNVGLNDADASYLYNSGTGRGRVAVSGESRRRRQSVSGGVL